MSEASKTRKRSRKSKLTVRNDVENEQTESPILQLESRNVMLPMASDSDHTYSLQHCTDSANIPQLSIKVEVEEFDESIVRPNDDESIETNHDHTTMQNYIPVTSKITEPTTSSLKITNDTCTSSVEDYVLQLNKPTPMNTQYIIEYSKNKIRMKVFHVDIEKMYKISDHISWISDNIADRYLNIELKNSWGRILKSVDRDLHNDLIQEALYSWSNELVLKSYCKEPPLFYQCLICQLAWWHFTPFKEHIRIHDPQTLTVYNLDASQEMLIVANSVRTKHATFIECKGKCYRCGYSYDIHEKMKKHEFRCPECCKQVLCCKWIQEHFPICVNKKREKYYEVMKFKCNICPDVFKSLDQLHNHIEISHTVRSDVPVPLCLRKCSVCLMKYHHYPTHVCLKSSRNAVCMYCFRKFSSKMLANVHMIIEGVKSNCRICDSPLPQRCTELQHLLKHSGNYQIVYKCPNLTCVPTMCFSDQASVKTHKFVYHKQKHDKRRTFFETVLLPRQCVKPEAVSDYDHYQACINYYNAQQKIVQTRPPITEKPEEIQPDVFQKHTETNVRTTDIDSDNGIKIKQEFDENNTDDSEMEYEDILAKMFNVHTPKPEPNKNDSNTQTDKQVSDTIQDTSAQWWLKVSTSENKQEKSNTKKRKLEKLKVTLVKVSDTVAVSPARLFNVSDERVPLKVSETSNTKTCQKNVETPKSVGLSNEEESLSKVFRVSDSFVKSFIDPVDTEIQIKTETEELSLEELIDIQENPITIKEEPIDIDYNHAQMVDNGYDHDQIVDNFNTQQSPSEEFDFAIQNVKSELKECDIDLSAVKIEQEYVEQSFLEATDMTIIEFANGNIKKQTDTTENLEIKVENVKSNIDINCTDDEKEENVNITEDVVKKWKSKCRQTKIYSCTKCGYSNTHKSYQIHMKSKCELSPSTDNVNKRYKCSKCDFSFSTIKAYLLHFESHGYKKLHCPECYSKFDEIKDLIPHFHKHIRFNYVNCWMIDINMVQKVKKNRCQICHKNVNQADFFPHWEGHLKLRTTAQIESPPVPVKTLGHESVYKKTLPLDILNATLEQLQAISSEKTCKVCNREFSRRSDIKRHIIEHLLLDAYSKKEYTPDNTFDCQLCSAKHRTGDRYKFHMRSHGSLPVYGCEVCDKTFSDSSNFAKHKKTHRLKVLICDICGKKFNAKLSLEKHILMHQVTEPIKCSLCPTLFYSKSQYKKHMQTRHMRMTRFKCVLCDLWFDSLRLKWDHAWAVHRERKHVADCPVCRRQFRKFADVKSHALKDHSLELKYYNLPEQKIKMLKEKNRIVRKRKVYLVPCSKME